MPSSEPDLPESDLLQSGQKVVGAAPDHVGGGGACSPGAARAGDVSAGRVLSDAPDEDDRVVRRDDLFGYEAAPPAMPAGRGVHRVVVVVTPS